MSLFYKQPHRNIFSMGEQKLYQLVNNVFVITNSLDVAVQLYLKKYLSCNMLSYIDNMKILTKLIDLWLNLYSFLCSHKNSDSI